MEDIAGEEMRLYLTDLALERARLALDVPAAFASPEAARAEAEAQTAKAAALIADTGYHHRDGELAELQARLAVSEKNDCHRPSEARAGIISNSGRCV